MVENFYQMFKDLKVAIENKGLKSISPQESYKSIKIDGIKPSGLENKATRIQNRRFHREPNTEPAAPKPSPGDTEASQ